MGATISIWVIVGIVISVLVSALVIYLVLRIDRCPSCGNTRAPAIVLEKETTLGHSVQRRCRKCGHLWEIYTGHDWGDVE